MASMAKQLSEEETDKNLKVIPGWQKIGNEIKKEFKCQNFSEAIRFVNRVAELAESMDHHPDILIHQYKIVTLTLTTHNAGGLTRLDFDLAQKIENIWKT